MSHFMLIFILLLKIYVITCTFPKCEEIFPSSDKPNCPYCASERIKKECASACESCNGDGSSKESGSSSSIGNSNSNSNSDSHSNSGGSNANCNDIKPCVEINQANTGYRSRCKSKGIPDNCADYCKYDVDPKKIMNAFQHKQCDMGLVHPMLYAAANDRNNTYCCFQQGLLDNEYKVCEPFCNPASKNWPQKPEAKYLKCLGYFEEFLNCHWASCRP